MNIDITKIKYGSIKIDFDYVFDLEQLKNTEIILSFAASYFFHSYLDLII